ncbi:hypothetical protein ACFW08_05820 [Streptomyces sp. NPDC058960]|uniref:hypothetical protein n=1 Tax=Streptomyces sp. NPDC058960 TaxID=3346679 RepID=UPI0036B6728A
MPTSRGPLLEALGALWDRLRADVPELPPIRPTVSPTTRRTDHSPRWTRDADGFVTGLVVSVDVIQEGAEAVLEMVLHDAAHLLNWRRDVKDVTMRGVYHNQSFITAAEEVGLTWPEDAERISGRGYVNPVVSTAALKRYAPAVRKLEEAIPIVLPHLELPDTPKTSRTPDRLTLQCQCDPPRKVRISRTVAAQGPITCGVCGKDFKAE